MAEPEDKKKEINTENSDQIIDNSEDTAPIQMNAENPAEKTDEEDPVEKLIEAFYKDGIVTSDKFETPEFLKGINHDNIPKEIFGCGDLNELTQFYTENSDKLTDIEKKFIAERIVNTKRIHELSAKYNKGELHPTININKTENSFLFPGLENSESQTSNNGCWSCSISLLLKSRGINISQREVREYRAGSNVDQIKANSAKISAPLFSDEETTMDEHLDILLHLLPNTGVHSKEVPWDNRETLKGEIIKTVEAAFENNSPISYNIGGHYVTIIGAKKDPNGNWILNVEDSLNSRIFDNWISVDKLIDCSGGNVTMSYLVDLTPDVNGLRKPIYKEDLEKRIIYEDNVIKPLSEIDDAPNQNAGNNKEGLTFYSGSFNEQTGNLIGDTLYVPKTTNPGATAIIEPSNNVSAKPDSYQKRVPAKKVAKKFNAKQMKVPSNKVAKKPDKKQMKVSANKVSEGLDVQKKQDKITDTTDFIRRLKENPVDEIKEINAVNRAMINIKKSIRDLEAAKTLVNSTQYKEIIDFLKDLEKPENKQASFSKENFAINMFKLGNLIDEYIDHKAIDGVKTNTYGKLAAVQKTNVWLSESLKDIGFIRPKDYVDVHNAYKAGGHDMTMIPEPGDVVLDNVADIIKDQKKETIKAVDDCICTIILKAEKEKRADLIKVRNEFNRGVLPKPKKEVQKDKENIMC